MINDLLVLLYIIWLLMHTTIRATYTMMSLADVISRLVDIRKKDNKYLLYLLERFKKECDIANIQLGKQLLDAFIKYTT